MRPLLKPTATSTHARFVPENVSITYHNDSTHSVIQFIVPFVGSFGEARIEQQLALFSVIESEWSRNVNLNCVRSLVHGGASGILFLELT